VTSKLLILSVSVVCLIGLVGCNTEAGYETETEGEEQVPPTGETQGRVGETQPGTDPSQQQQQQAQTGQSAAAAEFGTYEQWDADRSGDVTQQEFDTRFQNFQGWTQWDRNGDQNLDESEAAGVQWKMWDKNGDNRLEESEWQTGIEHLGLQAEYGEADREGDGQVSQAEFTQWFEQNAWDEWDANGDGVVGRDEAADVLWNMWDGNDDNRVDQSEWKEVMEA